MASAITSDWTGIDISGKFSGFSYNIVKQERNEKELVISFKVDGDNYSIHFDHEQNCCEYFGYKTTGNVEITKTDPNKFTKLTIGHTSEFDGDDNYKNEMHVKFKLSTADGNDDDDDYDVDDDYGYYKIIFYNNHNGYYSHYFILKKNNVAIFKTSL